MYKEPRQIISEGRAGSFKGKKILLVEDDTDIQLLVQAEFSGNELFSAENGLNALNILKERRDFDVILLDRLMPVMNGDEFMKELASQYPQVNIPIIMLTVAASREKVDSAEKLARELGLKFKYVIKPFTKDSIMAALVELGIAD